MRRNQSYSQRAPSSRSTCVITSPRARHLFQAGGRMAKKARWAVRRHFGMMEDYLATSPGDGTYMCGRNLTGADIMLSYPLIAGRDGAFDAMGTWEKGSFEQTFPKLHAYIGRLAEEPGWKRSVDK